jgi:vancomycin resistance protein YoaR
LAAGGLNRILTTPNRPEIELAGFATSLNGRTPAQKLNARRAAEALNGRIVRPGEVFSFNRIVKSWTWDQGYVKAPVSFDGELVRAYGGGVCQTSTTLYNAALLAGMTILERHPHVFAPSYVPPGRDAAVAQYNIDFQFRNPYSGSVRILADGRGDHLEVRLLGLEKPNSVPSIVTEILSAVRPDRRTRAVVPKMMPRRRVFVRNPGATGYRVVTYRVFSENGRETRRERLSDDSYQAMDRIVQINAEEVPAGL